MAHTPVPDPTWWQRCRRAWRRACLQRAGITLVKARDALALRGVDTDCEGRRPARPEAPRCDWAGPVDADTLAMVQFFFAQRLGLMLATPAVRRVLDGELVQRLQAGQGIGRDLEGELMDRLGLALMGAHWVGGQPERQRQAQRVALQQAARVAGWDVVAPGTHVDSPPRPALC